MRDELDDRESWFTRRTVDIADARDRAAHTAWTRLSSPSDDVVSGGEGRDALAGSGGRDKLAPPSRSFAQQRQAKPPARDDAGYYQLGWEWLSETGPRRHDFGPDDPATQVLRKHHFLQGVRDKVATGAIKPGKAQAQSYALGGWKGVPEFIKAYSAVPTGGASGNLAAAYLGSYKLTPDVRGIDKEGIATADFTVENTSSLASALHPPVLGYKPFYRDYVDPLINSLRRSGPGSATTQTFHWTEKIPTRPNPPSSGARR